MPGPFAYPQRPEDANRLTDYMENNQQFSFASAEISAQKMAEGVGFEAKRLALIDVRECSLSHH